jgi:hypothetical protein
MSGDEKAAVGLLGLAVFIVVFYVVNTIYVRIRYWMLDGYIGGVEGLYHYLRGRVATIEYVDEQPPPGGSPDTKTASHLPSSESSEVGFVVS